MTSAASHKELRLYAVTVAKAGKKVSASMTELHVLKADPKSTRHYRIARFCDDRLYVVANERSGRASLLTILSTPGMEVIHETQASSFAISSFAVSSAAGQLAAGTNDGRVVLLDINGRRVHTTRAGHTPVTSIAFNSQGEKLTTMAGRRCSRRWRPPECCR